MSTLENYKKSWESMKNRTSKEKLQYLLYYYKWYFIVTLLLVFSLVHFIYNNATAKEIALNGILINATPTTNAIDAFQKELNSKLEVDTSEYELLLNSNLSYETNSDGDTYNYQLFQTLQVWYTAGELDFLIGNHDFMTIMAYQEFFIDLSEVLTEEQYSFYEPYFYYIDKAIIDSDNFSIDVSLPACTDPSGMKDPIPVFIDISDCNKLSTIYNYNTDKLFFGMMPNAPHMKHAIITLDYLMKD